MSGRCPDTGLPYVGIPKLPQFNDEETLFMRVVDKRSSKGSDQRRVLGVRLDYLTLSEVAKPPKIKKFVDLEQVREVLFFDSANGVRHTLVKFRPPPPGDEAPAPEVDLYFIQNHDSRNERTSQTAFEAVLRQVADVRGIDVAFHNAVTLSELTHQSHLVKSKLYESPASVLKKEGGRSASPPEASDFKRAISALSRTRSASSNAGDDKGRQPPGNLRHTLPSPTTGRESRGRSLPPGRHSVASELDFAHSLYEPSNDSFSSSVALSRAPSVCFVMNEAALPPRVRPSAKIPGFADFPGLRFLRVVEKKSAKGHFQKRALAATHSHLMLADIKSNAIKRYIPYESITGIRYQATRETGIIMRKKVYQFLVKVPAEGVDLFFLQSGDDRNSASDTQHDFRRVLEQIFEARELTARFIEVAEHIDLAKEAQLRKPDNFVSPKKRIASRLREPSPAARSPPRSPIRTPTTHAPRSPSSCSQADFSNREPECTRTSSQPQYDPEHPSSIAKAIYHSLGADDRAIVRIVTAVRDDSCWSAVQAAFAERYPGYYNGSVAAALRQEMRGRDFARVQTTLAGFGAAEDQSTPVGDAAAAATIPVAAPDRLSTSSSAGSDVVADNRLPAALRKTAPPPAAPNGRPSAESPPVSPRTLSSTQQAYARAESERVFAEMRAEFPRTGSVAPGALAAFGAYFEPFAANGSLLLGGVVEMGAGSRRVLVLTTEHLLTVDFDGRVKRCVAVADIGEVHSSPTGLLTLSVRSPAGQDARGFTFRVNPDAAGDDAVRDPGYFTGFLAALCRAKKRRPAEEAPICPVSGLAAAGEPTASLAPFWTRRRTLFVRVADIAVGGGAARRAVVAVDHAGVTVSEADSAACIHRLPVRCVTGMVTRDQAPGQACLLQANDPAAEIVVAECADARNTECREALPEVLLRLAAALGPPRFARRRVADDPANYFKAKTLSGRGDDESLAFEPTTARERELLAQVETVRASANEQLRAEQTKSAELHALLQQHADREQASVSATSPGRGHPRGAGLLGSAAAVNFATRLALLGLAPGQVEALAGLSVRCADDLLDVTLAELKEKLPLPLVRRVMRECCLVSGGADDACLQRARESPHTPSGTPAAKAARDAEKAKKLAQERLRIVQCENRSLRETIGILKEQVRVLRGQVGVPPPAHEAQNWPGSGRGSPGQGTRASPGFEPHGRADPLLSHSTASVGSPPFEAQRDRRRAAPGSGGSPGQGTRGSPGFDRADPLFSHSTASIDSPQFEAQRDHLERDRRRAAAARAQVDSQRREASGPRAPSERGLELARLQEEIRKVRAGSPPAADPAGSGSSAGGGGEEPRQTSPPGCPPAGLAGKRRRPAAGGEPTPPALESGASAVRSSPAHGSGRPTSATGASGAAESQPQRRDGSTAATLRRAESTKSNASLAEPDPTAETVRRTESRKSNASVSDQLQLQAMLTAETLGRAESAKSNASLAEPDLTAETVRRTESRKSNASVSDQLQLQAMLTAETLGRAESAKSNASLAEPLPLRGDLTAETVRRTESRKSNASVSDQLQLQAMLTAETVRRTESAKSSTSDAEPSQSHGASSADAVRRTASTKSNTSVSQLKLQGALTAETVRRTESMRSYTTDAEPSQPHGASSTDAVRRTASTKSNTSVSDQLQLQGALTAETVRRTESSSTSASSTAGPSQPGNASKGEASTPPAEPTKFGSRVPITVEVTSDASSQATPETARLETLQGFRPSEPEAAHDEQHQPPAAVAGARPDDDSSVNETSELVLARNLPEEAPFQLPDGPPPPSNAAELPTRSPAASDFRQADATPGIEPAASNQQQPEVPCAHPPPPPRTDRAPAVPLSPPPAPSDSASAPSATRPGADAPEKGAAGLPDAARAVRVVDVLQIAARGLPEGVSPYAVAVCAGESLRTETRESGGEQCWDVAFTCEARGGDDLTVDVFGWTADGDQRLLGRLVAAVGELEDGKIHDLKAPLLEGGKLSADGYVQVCCSVAGEDGDAGSAGDRAEPRAELGEFPREAASGRDAAVGGSAALPNGADVARASGSTVCKATPCEDVDGVGSAGVSFDTDALRARAQSDSLPRKANDHGFTPCGDVDPIGSAGVSFHTDAVRAQAESDSFLRKANDRGSTPCEDVDTVGSARVSFDTDAVRARGESDKADDHGATPIGDDDGIVGSAGLPVDDTAGLAPNGTANGHSRAPPPGANGLPFAPRPGTRGRAGAASAEVPVGTFTGFPPCEDVDTAGSAGVSFDTDAPRARTESDSLPRETNHRGFTPCEDVDTVGSAEVSFDTDAPRARTESDSLPRETNHRGFTPCEDVDTVGSAEVSFDTDAPRARARSNSPPLGPAFRAPPGWNGSPFAPKVITRGHTSADAASAEVSGFGDPDGSACKAGMRAGLPPVAAVRAPVFEPDASEFASTEKSAAGLRDLEAREASAAALHQSQPTPSLPTTASSMSEMSGSGRSTPSEPTNHVVSEVRFEHHDTGPGSAFSVTPEHIHAVGPPQESSGFSLGGGFLDSPTCR
ncbi:hypothetical protein DIPPA_02857 [Diplonema papillatum]|nr:hypothetical protein DIPPA_02857 [Diplonema papillatum]